MLGRFMGGDALQAASPLSTSLSVTPQLIRDVINEVSQTRASNLAFQQAVRDHERSEINKLAVPSVAAPTLSSGGRSSTATRGSRRNDGQPVNRTDLQIRPMSASVPSRVPANIRSQYFWDIVKIRSTVALSNAAASEQNYAWNLASHPQYQQLQQLFDQWCIPQASVTFMNDTSSTLVPIELHSAVDFDNIANIGIVIDQFDNTRIDVITGSKKVTRTVRPCNKSRLGGADNAGLVRQWTDSAVSAVTWYGIRSYYPVSATAATVLVEQTIWYCFRSRI